MRTTTVAVFVLLAVAAAVSAEDLVRQEQEIQLSQTSARKLRFLIPHLLKGKSAPAPAPAPDAPAPDAPAPDAPAPALRRDGGSGKGFSLSITKGDSMPMRRMDPTPVSLGVSKSVSTDAGSLGISKTVAISKTVGAGGDAGTGSKVTLG